MNIIPILNLDGNLSNFCVTEGDGQTGILQAVFRSLCRDPDCDGQKFAEFLVGIQDIVNKLGRDDRLKFNIIDYYFYHFYEKIISRKSKGFSNEIYSNAAVISLLSIVLNVNIGLLEIEHRKAEGNTYHPMPEGIVRFYQGDSNKGKYILLGVTYHSDFATYHPIHNNQDSFIIQAKELDVFTRSRDHDYRIDNKYSLVAILSKEENVKRIRSMIERFQKVIDPDQFVNDTMETIRRRMLIIEGLTMS